MHLSLQQIKLDATAWIDSLLPTLPFLVAIKDGGRRGWQDASTKKLVTLPEAPGIYIVYPLTNDVPVYIGEASNLRRRLTYHFAESLSSNRASTLKKNLRRDGTYDDGPIAQICRLRYVEVPFGRTEIEEYLHTKFRVNTKQTLGSK